MTYRTAAPRTCLGAISELLESRRLMSGTISVSAYLDVNNNGTYDANEEITGAFFYLDNNNNSTFDNGEPNQTNGVGGATFNVADGSYRVRMGGSPYATFDPPGGMISVDVLNNSPTIRFGISNTVGTTSGVVFSDVNRNSSFDGAGTDPVLTGMRVYADTNTNGEYESTEPSVLSNANGEWTLALAPGQVDIRIIADNGYAVAIQNGVSQVTIVAGQATTAIEFPLEEMGNSEISGRLFDDVNGNEIRDFPADEYLVNWTIYLDANNNQTRDQNEETATTNSQGEYVFTGLVAGTYRLRVDVQAGYTAASPAGGTLVLVMPANHSTDNNTLTVQQTPTAVSVRNDFNGDGKPDLLFRNAATGVNSVWYMNGAQRLGTATLPVFNGATWIIGATGDFNRDGKTDVVFHDTSTGEHILWFLNGIIRTDGVDVQQVNPVWRMVGGGDFNDDGDTDLVFRNTQTGAATVWYMNNNQEITSFGALPKVATQAWQIAGVEDFDGDGDPDLLWTNAGAKRNSLWLMNNRTIISDGFRGIPYPAAAGWRLARVTILNDDTTPDLLWANDTAGTNSLWLLGNVSGKPVPFVFSKVQVTVPIPA